ncbi:ABC transporter substrate-binding protein [Streptomyces amakusaensis]|uniref:ABC transporter substrate-binding protein n=1 Tax=Streptomyces amakusaensis TaxID=67271 RepID=A0ABW0ASZ4_9ACTN
MVYSDHEPPQCSGGHVGMSTGAGIDVQRRLETLIRDFRANEPPMPVVVLHADEASDDGKVTNLVEELYTGQDTHGTRCAVAPAQQEGPTEVRRAAGLVRELGDPRRWDSRHSIYRRYAFPRLRLVRAIEDAVGELDADWPQAPSAAGSRGSPPDPAQQLLDQLARQRWRPKGAARWSSGLRMFDMAHILPASLVAVLAALLARSHWSVALASGTGFLLLLVVLDNVLPGRAPIFLWLRRESRWFMTTTFLRAAARGRPTDVSLLRPARSWNAISARAYDVAEALKSGDDFQLQLYVLALFEDLRDNHRRWSWDLRGFKRPRPPALFLPQLTEANGGIELIKAVSDVRSRRSELDPLLIVAAARGTDVPRLQRSVIQGPGGTPQTWYHEWARNLRAGQSPSREPAQLPWVLKVALPSARLVPVEGLRHCVRTPSRPTVARLVWSLHAMGLVGVLLTAGLAVRAETLYDRHCSASLLSANGDTVKRSVPHGRTECVGIATGKVRFGDWVPKEKKGEERKNGRRPGWTLADLEKAVKDANTKVVGRRNSEYVTIVYAGPLSADPEGGSSPLKGVEELAGVYLAQSVINENSPIGLRVLIANGGVDMLHQKEMAKAVAAYAAKDRTLVGVVGNGRNLESSKEATRILRNADLAVVSGTNSATQLAREFGNWFSLAATDEWQVEQLGLIAAQLRKPGRRQQEQQHAVVLTQEDGNADDLYTKEQAEFGMAMLRDQDFKPTRKGYAVKGGKPELPSGAEGICDGGSTSTVIYFAGRVEHLGPLMNQLGTDSGCENQDISILGGDDLSKADFSPNGVGVGSKVTLYHSVLAELEQAAEETAFYQEAAKHLPGLDSRRLSPTTPVLASGQTALAHDATRALHAAATRSGGSHTRAETWVNLRTVRLSGMATGTIDFTGATPYKNRKGHSIALKEVRRGDGGSSRSRVLCSRLAGNTEPLTKKECAIRKK